MANESKKQEKADEKAVAKTEDSKGQAQQEVKSDPLILLINKNDYPEYITIGGKRTVLDPRSKDIKVNLSQLEPEENAPQGVLYKRI